MDLETIPENNGRSAQLALQLSEELVYKGFVNRDVLMEPEKQTITATLGRDTDRGEYGHLLIGSSFLAENRGLAAWSPCPANQWRR